MKLGYFMMPLHHIDTEYHQTLKDDMEAIIYADELGYTEAWVGEHYSSAVEQITSPLMFHANLINRTKQIKLASGVMCLPQYHPAVTAGQAAMFDHLSEGRFIMGVGPGGLLSDFELFGVMDQNRMEMMIEALDQMLELWSTPPPYEMHGKYWTIDMPEWTHHDIKLGYVPQPFSTTPSADCDLRCEPVIQLAQIRRRARLHAGNGELHRAMVGENPLARLLCRRRQHWAHARSGNLACRPQYLRRRDRRRSRGLRRRGRRHL